MIELRIIIDGKKRIARTIESEQEAIHHYSSQRKTAKSMWVGGWRRR
jgi:hypothetical protein